MLSSDPADLFCQLYDTLTDAGMSRDRAWRRNAHLEALTAETRGNAMTLELHPRWMGTRLREVEQRTGEGPTAVRWAAARGIDQALAACHTVTGTPAGEGERSPLEQRVRQRYAATGRFDSGEVPGALLPKFADAGRRGEATVSRAQAFATVHRVPAEAWDSDDVDFRRVRSKHQPIVRRRENRPGIVVACVPMLESLEELELASVEEDGAHFFTGRPLGTTDLEERIRTVLRRMDDSGAMLGICPELSLSEPLLEAWRQAVLEPSGRDAGALQWIFVGSGPFAGGEGTPPYNRGVVIHRRTGQVVFTQDKLFPFTLMPEQITEWGLGDIFSSRVDELMARGEKLCIRETAWGRIAVLICEDLAKVLEHKAGRLVSDFGVSVLVAPVFSKEVKAYFWEHQPARSYADHLGTVTMVANSLVVPRASGEHGEVGTCLVNAPGSFEVGRSRRADQVSLFWLTSQHVEVPSTHPVLTDCG